ncbi:MAG: hypothetical protein KA340_09240 [Saprospiraceae bacterium]|nr:hypothetical protein [Saprospiraceae bacterium]
MIHLSLFKKFSFIIGILSLLTWTKVAGQQKNLILDHYTDREGLTTLQALTITQDDEGYIWIGTENGLARYDGHKFKYFRYNSADSTTIRSNYIKHFSLDQYNRLWLITNESFGFFDIKELKYKRLKTTVEPPRNVFKYRYDAPNDITYLVCQNGIYTITGKKAELKKLKLDGTEGISFTDFIKAEDRYIGSSIYGLYIFDKNGHQIEKYFRPGVTIQNERENDFLNLYYEKADDMLYIGCWSNGLYTLDLASGEMEKYLYNNKPNIQNGIITIFQYPLFGFENSLLLGTMDGIKVFNKSEKKIRPFTDFLFPNKEVVEGAGLHFWQDQNASLWIGTLNGIYKLDPKKQLFDRIPIPTVEGWVVNRMYVDQHTKRDSLLWLQYEYATLHLYDLIHQKFRPLPAKLNPYNQVESKNNDFYIDRKGRLWLASSLNGIVLYDKNKDQINLPRIEHSLGKNLKFLKIYEDREGTMFFSCIHGLFRYNASKNVIEEATEFNSYITSKKLGLYVRDLCFDSKNRMWAIALDLNSPLQYLYYQDPLTKSFYAFNQKNHADLNQLPSFENIICIEGDRILINSFSGYGIGSLQKNQLKFTSFTHFGKTPIIANRMAALDGHQNVWICSDNGLYLLNNRQNRISIFNKSNSVVNKTRDSRIFYSSQSDRLYLNQQNYLLACKTDPFNYVAKEQIRLTDISISQMPGLKPSNFSKLVLNPEQNSIQLHFSNLNLTNSQNNFYEYRLNGDSTWTGIEGSELHFNNMGYGDYLLEVRGYNSFGVLSSKNYRAVFSILPPYYKTWWFQTLIFLLILVAVYSFFKFREIQYKKLTRIRLNIARDLHDDLGSNLSSIKILSELSASANAGPDKEVLKHIAEKSRSMMGSISDIVWSINPGKDTLEELVHKIQIFAIDSLESIDINLHFEVPDPIPSMPIPLEYRRHLYLIFKEGINNIAKYSGAQNVRFSILVNGNNLVMALRDDGKGFDMDLKSNGNGIANIRSRADEMNARLRMHSSSVGTVVEITVNIP